MDAIVAWGHSGSVKVRFTYMARPGAGSAHVVYQPAGSNRKLVDPSLAVAAMGATPTRLLDDLETLGLLFESLVVRDLRVYAGDCGAEVYHCRTSYGDEIDAVVERRDGAWLAVEVKLGPARVDEAARSLLKACATVDAGERGDPVRKVVVTAVGYGYERYDGVSAVPVTALGPAGQAVGRDRHRRGGHRDHPDQAAGRVRRGGPQRRPRRLPRGGCRRCTCRRARRCAPTRTGRRVRPASGRSAGPSWATASGGPVPVAAVASTTRPRG
ncbi:MAG: DUF4143 domain-containing protein [Acidimicrobiaceae bacterium]|nr:DUF4143 domain-containing protein [Acidimicrobiaceae bacterium]MXZ98949.1 DUF4143 domain-containing protein [Acidimicrobiaceae bacterium]MYE75212.1 DUF4143 domain-containing protein [Acidimicrobiaceae bacterium]MYE97588.1 DUF4143 domain-containing protein [Acidimicrobiaceae bacterium]MYI53713.1 DUF4143 domain-containing protein [Acidimicrobiaceae bacterium]